MKFVPVYAAVLAILFVYLAIRTIRTRQRLRISLGDSGDAAMLRAIRVHANFAEYVPFAILLAAFVEIEGTRSWVVHALCGALLVGRVLHALAIGGPRMVFPLRVTGMVLTFSSLLGSAAILLYHAMK